MMMKNSINRSNSGAFIGLCPRTARICSNVAEPARHGLPVFRHGRCRACEIRGHVVTDFKSRLPANRTLPAMFALTKSLLPPRLPGAVSGRLDEPLTSSGSVMFRCAGKIFTLDENK